VVVYDDWDDAKTLGRNASGLRWKDRLTGNEWLSEVGMIFLVILNINLYPTSPPNGMSTAV
jgi:hypothetical protein